MTRVYHTIRHFYYNAYQVKGPVFQVPLYKGKAVGPFVLVLLVIVIVSKGRSGPKVRLLKDIPTSVQHRSFVSTLS
jgi:hypothetical protein